MAKKEKSYRSKSERIKNAAGMKRGGCIELFRPITNCNAADLGRAEVYDGYGIDGMKDFTVGELCDSLGVSELYFKTADVGEAMRDMDDVEAVMTEKNIVGTCLAYRRVGEKTRAMQQVVGFVKPKQVIGEDGEEHGPAEDEEIAFDMDGQVQQ